MSLVALGPAVSRRARAIATGRTTVATAALLASAVLQWSGAIYAGSAVLAIGAVHHSLSCARIASTSRRYDRTRFALAGLAALGIAGCFATAGAAPVRHGATILAIGVVTAALAMVVAVARSTPAPGACEGARVLELGWAPLAAIAGGDLAWMLGARWWDPLLCVLLVPFAVRAA